MFSHAKETCRGARAPNRSFDTQLGPPPALAPLSSRSDAISEAAPEPLAAASPPAEHTELGPGPGGASPLLLAPSLPERDGRCMFAATVIGRICGTTLSVAMRASCSSSTVPSGLAGTGERAEPPTPNGRGAGAGVVGSVPVRELRRSFPEPAGAGGLGGLGGADEGRAGWKRYGRSQRSLWKTRALRGVRW